MALDRLLRGTWRDDTLTGLHDLAEERIEGLGGNDTIHGGPGRNLLFGQGGNDTLYGGDDLAHNDLLFGGVGNDRLDGGAGRNYLWGGSGDDTAILRAGGDDAWTKAYGGTGDDTYVMHGLHQPGETPDLIVENAGEGWDLIDIRGRYDDPAGVLALPDNVEAAITIHADQRATLIGNDLDNILSLGQGGGVVVGGAGDDLLAGYSFYDPTEVLLIGGSGADIFWTFGMATAMDFDQGEGDKLRLDPGANFVGEWTGAFPPDADYGDVYFEYTAEGNTEVWINDPATVVTPRLTLIGIHEITEETFVYMPPTSWW